MFNLWFGLVYVASVDKKLDAYHLFIGKYRHAMIKTFKQFLCSGFIAVAGMFAEWLASVEFPVDL